MNALLVVFLAGAAVALMGHRKWRSLAFTAWVYTFIAASLAYPGAFGTWGSVDLKVLIVPLVQLIMFGMGTKLSVGDFTRVLKMQWPVVIGVSFHFGVMPLTGFLLAKAFGFPPEIAAGVILIGSVSSGVASNVIVYLSGGNVALAVTITACSTLLSPVMTPFLMQALAGRLVPVRFFDMMLEILNMVIVPVVTGLLANRLLDHSGSSRRRAGWLPGAAVAAFGLAVAVRGVPREALGPLGALQSGVVLGLALWGLVAAAKLGVLWLRGPSDWLDKALPVISMAGICLIIAIITARSRDKLLSVGPALIGAAMLHNGIGYLLGYALARAVRLDEATSRTVAVEVGMQNGGMATGLAMSVLHSADAALAPAIFGPWQNISGSILASWWRRRPVAAAAPPAFQPSPASGQHLNPNLPPPTETRS